MLKVTDRGSVLAGDRDRWRLQGGKLLPQRQDLVRPEPCLAKPGEEPWESGVFPAPRQPGAMVDLAEAAQWFDQVAFAAIEIAEHLVTFQEFGELLALGNLVPVEQ